MQYYTYGDEEDQIASILHIRHLYAAILELAIRDLETGSRVETTSAVLWFTSTVWQDINNDRITYTEVRDVLRLPFHAVTKINHILKLAELRRFKLIQAESPDLRGQFVLSEDYVKTSANGALRRKFRKRRVNSS